MNAKKKKINVKHMQYRSSSTSQISLNIKYEFFSCKNISNNLIVNNDYTICNFS